MAQTIGNPLSWSVRTLRDALDALGMTGRKVAGPARGAESSVAIRDFGSDEIEDALRRGFDDFVSLRSDAVFLIVLYPIIGLALVGMALRESVLHLVVPAVTGFALLGPLAAVGLYEMSRRRERGEAPGWLDAFSVMRLPTIGSIFLLGLILIAIFAVWITVADWLYLATIGAQDHATIAALLADVFTTPGGWVMLIVGTAIGAVFAALVLSISVVSFPLLVDRDVTLAEAIRTSLRVTARNPASVMTWGAVVAVLLFLGALPLMLGLVVVLPVLGHATWHLYRRAVVPEEGGEATATRGG